MDPSGQQIDEPNNNSKNSSFDDTIDYDDSIQNHDLKESQVLKKGPTEADMKYMKNFPARNHYDDHQTTPYNGGANANDDYRMTNIDERKMNEDGNSSMNYASSDEMNQNAASSDHGEKLGSGSEEEGKHLHFKRIVNSQLKFPQMMHARRRSIVAIERHSRPTSCTSSKEHSRRVIIPMFIRVRSSR